MLEILLDPERRKKAKEEQDRLRAQYGHRIVTDPAQQHFFAGQAREQSLLAALDDDDLSASQTTFFLNQLADAYDMQGRFSEAAEVSQSPEHKADYQTKAEAITNIGKRCQCDPFILFPVPNDAKGRREPAMKETQRIWNGEKLISFQRCAHCKTVSAEYV